MHPLSKRLLSLDEDVFSHGPPRALAEIEALDNAVGAPFPDDYRAVLTELGPFQVRGSHLWLILELPTDLLPDILDDFEDGRMPGVVFIANDNGDWGYYYDVNDRLGGGRFALYFVDRGTRTFEASRFVAPSLAAAIELLLAGDNFRDRPPLG